jgi:hypothetical protein
MHPKGLWRGEFSGQCTYSQVNPCSINSRIPIKSCKCNLQEHQHGDLLIDTIYPSCLLYFVGYQLVISHRRKSNKVGIQLPISALAFDKRRHQLDTPWWERQQISMKTNRTQWLVGHKGLKKAMTTELFSGSTEAGGLNSGFCTW